MCESNGQNKSESVADVLARMQTELSYGSSATDDGAGDATGGVVADVEKKESPSISSNPALKEVASHAGLQDANDVESVTDYMGSLLQRYGGGDEYENAPKVTALPQKSDPVKELSFEIGDNCVLPVLLNASDYVPEKIAPEKKDNIAAMRELSVQSARKAIQESVRKKRTSDAALRLLTAIGTAVLGLGSFVFAEVGLNLLTLLGACSLGASGYFFYLTRSGKIVDPTSR